MKEEEKLESTIAKGSDIAGGAVSAAIGFLIGGPAGAAVGGAAGLPISMALRKVGKEVSNRWLGSKEEERVGGVLAITANKISERISKGQKIREDGLFEKNSTGEEIIERALIVAQREPEEKKLVYVANLLTNICFDRSIDTIYSHQLIRCIESLSYRQLCLLRFIWTISTAVGLQAYLKEGDYRGVGDQINRELWSLLHDCMTLYQLNLINFGGEVAFGLTDVKPKAIRLQSMGHDLTMLAELMTIPNEDIVELLVKFRKDNTILKEEFRDILGKPIQ